MEVSETELQGLYTWVDEIPLSRPKRNIGRDFSDGVLMAEVVHHYFPKLVELHNYSSANGTQQKMYNWNTLNQKALKRMGFAIAKEDMVAMCNCQAGAVERVLKLLKTKIAKCTEEGFTGIPLAAPAPAPAPAAPQAKMQQQQQQPHQHQQQIPYQQQQQQQQQQHMMPQPHMAVAAPRGVAQPQLQQPPAQAPMSLQSRMPVMGAHGEEVLELRETLTELKETNEILETKVRKLEQLVRLKDAKIQTLMAKLQAAGMA